MIVFIIMALLLPWQLVWSVCLPVCRLKRATPSTIQAVDYCFPSAGRKMLKCRGSTHGRLWRHLPFAMQMHICQAVEFDASCGQKQIIVSYIIAKAIVLLTVI